MISLLNLSWKLMLCIAILCLWKQESQLLCKVFLGSAGIMGEKEVEATWLSCLLTLSKDCFLSVKAKGKKGSSKDQHWPMLHEKVWSCVFPTTPLEKVVLVIFTGLHWWIWVSQILGSMQVTEGTHSFEANWIEFKDWISLTDLPQLS